PCASSASIHVPDSRVSRPIRICKRVAVPGRTAPPLSARTSAAPRRRTVGGSSGYAPAVPRTPSVPNRRGTLFDTGNAHLHSRRIDMRHARFVRRVGAYGQRILTGPETAEINVHHDVIGFHAVQAFTAAPQGDV